jgi:hypothetical protein
MHLEGEGADRHEEPQQKRGVDRDRRREDQDRQDDRGDHERGGEEVVRRLVDPHREHQQSERAQQHDRREACEL